MRLLYSESGQKRRINNMISPVHKWTAERTGLQDKLNDWTLRNWQHEKLRQFVTYAKENTRFYRDLPGNFNDITELPFTFPTDIADPMAFLAISPGDVERITTLNTSGTTGDRKRIFFSIGDIERIKDYFAVGMSSLTVKGWHTQILISDDTINSLGYLLREALGTLGITSSILPVIPDKDFAISASRGADCIVGMPAELLYMCRTEPGLRPKSILLTADYIPQSIVKALRETWECDVFTHYGMTETGFGYAVDCEYHSGHHTRDAEIIVEIVDPMTGKPSISGEKGEIVLTMLSNEAMPLIRYRTGDLSYFIESTCKCGGSLRRLGTIESRFEDDIIVPGFPNLNIHVLDEILFSISFVRGFNAAFTRQENDSHLYLVIDSTEKINPTTFDPIVYPGMHIHIRYGTCDPFTHRGKRRIYTDINHPLLKDYFNSKRTI